MDLACCPQEEEVVLTADSNISDLSNLSFTSGKWSASIPDALDPAIALLADQAYFCVQGTPQAWLLTTSQAAKAAAVLMSCSWSRRCARGIHDSSRQLL